MKIILTMLLQMGIVFVLVRVVDSSDSFAIHLCFFLFFFGVLLLLLLIFFIESLKDVFSRLDGFFRITAAQDRIVAFAHFFGAVNILKPKKMGLIKGESFFFS